MSADNISPRPQDRYWPTVAPEDLGDQVRSRYLEYVSELERRKLLALWALVQEVYDGYDPGTNSFAAWVTEGGEQGEFLHLHVNEFASLVRHQHTLTSSADLVFEPIAKSDTPKAEASATLGKQAIRNYQSAPHNLDQLLDRQLERMLLFGAGYLVQLWDAYRGPETGVEEVPEIGEDGQPIMEDAPMPPDPGMGDAPPEPQGMQVDPAAAKQPKMRERTRRGGDLAHRVYSPIDVACDLGVRTMDDVRWRIVRERWNRFELAARYPEHAPYILERPAYDADELSRFERKSASQSRATTDEISCLRLLHDRTEAVSDGMEAFVCGDRVLGPVMPLVYTRMPVHVMCPQEVIDTPIPRAMNWDLLGPQAAYNQAIINGITSSDAGSVPKWAIERKSGVKVENLGSNMRAVWYDANPQAPALGVPQLLEMPALNGTHLQQMEAFRGIMQILSNVNAVARGESEGKSGADNALLAAQTQQNLSSYAKARAQAARSAALGIVEALQKFATEERMIRVFGEDETWSVSYFTGADLDEVQDIDVDIGDPVTRSFVGRMQLADKAVQMWPQEFTAQSWMAFIASGRHEPLFKSARNSARLIKAENAQLAKGQPQPVIKTDIHAAHIQEHLAQLSSPAIRADQAIASTVLNHVAEHTFLWTKLALEEPALLAATGQQPPPMPMMSAVGPDGAPMGGAPGAPPGGPPDANKAPPADRANVGGKEEGPGGVPLPSAPKNPMTGEPAPTPGGG